MNIRFLETIWGDRRRNPARLSALASEYGLGLTGRFGIIAEPSRAEPSHDLVRRMAAPVPPTSLPA